MSAWIFAAPTLGINDSLDTTSIVGSGKIIFTASMLSFQGGINVIGYTAAKSGVAGLTRALANEWAGRNVQVNATYQGRSGCCVILL